MGTRQTRPTAAGDDDQELPLHRRRVHGVLAIHWQQKQRLEFQRIGLWTEIADTVRDDSLGTLLRAEAVCVRCRDQERRLWRWGFAVAYLLEGAMLSAFLIEVAKEDRFTWVCNVVTDLILVAFFLLYCQNIANKRVRDSSFSFFFVLMVYRERLRRIHGSGSRLNTVSLSFPVGWEWFSVPCSP